MIVIAQIQAVSINAGKTQRACCDEDWWTVNQWSHTGDAEILSNEGNCIKVKCNNSVFPCVVFVRCSH